MIRFRLNGAPVDLDVDPEALLLPVLRNRLRAVGTRFGCGIGECGACFVLVDGHPTPSCTTPLWAVDRKDVVSVEGLGSPAAPHPLQAAMIGRQAVQCGYCASGVLISAAALLAGDPSPTEAKVRSALAGNLCRCGAQNRMVAAVLDAAGAMRSGSASGPTS